MSATKAGCPLKRGPYSMVNHHYLNRNNTDFKHLKTFLTKELEKPKPNFHIPFHLMLFELAELTDHTDDIATLVNVDPDLTYDETTAELMVRLSTTLKACKHDNIKSLEQYYKLPTKEQNIYAIMDGLHRTFILHELLQSDFDKYHKIFNSVLCNVVIYYKQPEKTLHIKKAMFYAKEYSAILADEITKSVGHTMSDGMQACLNYIIAEDNEGK
jgi:hypothetical protein